MRDATHRMVGPQEFVSPEGLAALLALPVATVYGWRTKGVGPRGIKVGRHVRYRRSDVDAWLEAQSDTKAS